MQQTPHALPSAALYQRCDPDSLSFESTEELEPLKEIPGQQRAIEALRFAAGIDIDGHNVFVLGETGSGRHDFVQQFLGTEAAAQEVPHDWVYVYNFDDPRRPRALALPPGRAVNVRDDVRQLIADAQSALPEAFESDDFQARRETIAEAFKEAQEAAFKEVEEEAGKHDIGIVHTPSGVAFVPVRDDEALGLEPRVQHTLGVGGIERRAHGGDHGGLDVAAGGGHDRQAGRDVPRAQRQVAVAAQAAAGEARAAAGRQNRSASRGPRVTGRRPR